MQVELRSIQRKLGHSFIFVTHDQEEALSLSDRVAVMNGGRIEQVGTPREVYENPKTAFVSQFIGSANSIAGRFLSSEDGMDWIEAAGRLGARPGSGLKPGASARLWIRPERTRLDRKQGFLRGVVRRQVFQGAWLQIGVALAHGEWEVWLPSSGAGEPAELGSEIWLSWERDSAWILGDA
jgi:spermidine/putrescine transport system ATP-binding protein